MEIDAWTVILSVSAARAIAQVSRRTTVEEPSKQILSTFNP